MIELLNRVQPHFSSHILLYHSTFSRVPNSIKEGLHNVTPDNIYRQISWLKRYFDIVELDELFTQNDILGKVAITFDDAYLSVFEEALPVLATLAVPSTIFVNGASLEGKVFWRDKIRFLINNSLVEDFLEKNISLSRAYNLTAQNFYKISKSSEVNSRVVDTLLDSYLEESGISLESFCVNSIKYIRDNPLVLYGNHTYSHYVLSSLSREQQEEEIAKNHKLLEDCGVRLSKVFSIPFGGDRDFNSITIELLKKYNYIGFLYSKNSINTKREKNIDRELISKDRYMVSPDFKSFQKQIFKLGIRGLI